MQPAQKADGMNYAPQGRPQPVCQPGEFRFAAIGLDHGHIHGMCNGLAEAGAELVRVYDPDPQKVQAFCSAHPGVQPARSDQEILDDPAIQLIASAPVPSQRGPLGLRALDHGKDYFTDKPPFTTAEQLAAARLAVHRTRRIFAVYYSERLHVEAAVRAGQIIQEGALGRIVHMVGLGPHRLNAPSRPPWFWNPKHYGGILVDLGCHQIEQFLFYTGAQSARVLHSKIANYSQPDHPEFQDFGDATLLADNGATFYFRVDWFTPDGLRAWGDGRTFVVGTQATLELRKYLDVARDPAGDHLYLVDPQGEHHLSLQGQVGYPYFGQLIRDCLDRTQTAMPQAHTFLAIELALQAQAQALRIAPPL
jgi:predicted dehydrogenase